MLVRILTHMRSQFVGYLALFVALGGTSYAVVKLPAGSVTSREVKNRSLLAVDFKKGQLPRGRRGPQGPPGDPADFDAKLYYTKVDSDSRFLGRTAKAADADKLDGHDAGAFGVVAYARVQPDGTLAAERKAVVSATRTSTGQYMLRLAGLPGSGCVGLASLEDPNVGLDAPPVVGFVAVRRSGSDLLVRTVNTSGASANIGFTALVVC